MTERDAENGDIGSKRSVRRAPSLGQWVPGTELSQLTPGELRVWAVDLDAGVDPDDVDVAEPGTELEVLVDDERARSARFVRARDRRRFARCRASLRQILGQLLHQSPHSLRFRAIGHGKPELDLESMGWEIGEERTQLRFNVSHSSNLALIGVSQGRELGVDVERIKEMSDLDRMAASVFSSIECTTFATVPAHLKPLAFFRCWTRKEAVLKGMGIGLAGLSSFYETGFGTAELPAHFITSDPPPQMGGWQFWEVAPQPGFVAAVAVDIAEARDSGEAALAAARSSLPA